MRIPQRWKSIPDQPNYLISNKGNVFSVTRKKEMTPYFRSGHLTVQFGSNKSRKQVYVSDLVAEAFLGPRPEGQRVKHINKDITDNRACNLEYGKPGDINRFMYEESSLPDHAVKARLKGLWSSMKARCSPGNNAPRSRNYSKKGIKVCDEWLDFDTFYAWAVKDYKPGLTLDRIDNLGNYEPSNCQWLTRADNANKEHCKMIEAFGESKSIADWARDPRCLVKSAALCQRLLRGMTPELAITLPKQKSSKPRKAA